MTRYLVRVYEVDIKAAHEAGKTYLQQNGYEIRKDQKERNGSMLLQAFKDNDTSSVIIRSKSRKPGITSVEMKVGKQYNREHTIQMMDAYQKLLPKEAQPK